MTKHTMAITRAVGVIGATVALVAGITFANLTSNSVTLSDNTASTASAQLALVSPNDLSDVTTLPGFNFTDLLPGVASSDFDFTLHNTGTSPLTISAAWPALSTTGGLSLSQVHVKLTAVSGSVVYENTMDNLSSQSAVVLPGADIAGESTADYKVSITIDPSYSGSGGGVNPFNLVFTGTQPSVE